MELPCNAQFFYIDLSILHQSSANNVLTPSSSHSAAASSFPPHSPVLQSSSRFQMFLFVPRGMSLGFLDFGHTGCWRGFAFFLHEYVHSIFLHGLTVEERGFTNIKEGRLAETNVSGFFTVRCPLAPPHTHTTHNQKLQWHPLPKMEPNLVLNARRVWPLCL